MTSLPYEETKQLDDQSGPQVSVLIAAYNRAGTLQRTLESVFAQSLAPLEVVVADDGSTDNTRTVVAAICNRYPRWRNRLHYFHQPNQGKSVALNNALKLARGEWIAYNDSDDVWQPDKLERQYAALTRFPECGACVTDAVFVNSSAHLETAFTRGGFHFEDTVGRVAGAAELMAGSFRGVYMQTLLIRRSLVDSLAGFDPQLRVSQDVDFLFRLALVADICYVKLPLVQIERGPAGGAERLTVRFPFESVVRLQLHQQMYTKWLSIIPCPQPKLNRLITRQFHAVCSALANHYLLADDSRNARRALERALRARFRAALGLKWILTFCVPASLLSGFLSGVSRAKALRRAASR